MIRTHPVVSHSLLVLVVACSTLVTSACQRGSGARPDSRAESQVFFEAVHHSPEVALSKAVDWLWRQQGEDGGWHSATYRLLESGQALTPFVLFVLLEADVELAAHADNADAALNFIRRQLGSGGVMGLADREVPEYPNYATAYALRCLVVGGDPQDGERIARMKRYLLDQQYRDASGFGPASVVYGGWGFGGQLPRGSPGHMDIHHTRCVLEALCASGVDDRAVFGRAERFLALMQRRSELLRSRPSHRESASFAVWDGPYDGGFYFSPVVLAANKGGIGNHGEARFYRSYATATCDGILALLACGALPTDPRIRGAVQWLAEHPQMDWPGGVPRDAAENWGESIRFTHFATRAETMHALRAPPHERQALWQEVTRHQMADGHFQNRDGFLMKEDDALLCTALAILTLSRFDW